MGNLLLEPWIWLLIIILTLSGTAFSLFKYTVGKGGTEAILDRFPQIGRERLDRCAELYERHGPIILLLTGVPGLDTIVCTVAGAVGVKRTTFIFWVMIAKLVRSWLIAVVLTGAVNLINR